MASANRRVDSRRAGNVNHEHKDHMIFEQIMLRFRPIAPRPETASKSGALLSEKELKRTRVKRKYVRVKKTKKKNNNNNNNIASKSWFNLDQTVAMIEESSEVAVTVTDPLQKEKEERLIISDLHGVDLAMAVQRKVVESWITLESVTGTCEDRRLLGYTDDEIWNNLEHDTCPGFVSNGCDKVQWVNPAYRSMLDPSSNGHDSIETEVAVWLKINVEKSTVVKYLPAFSCSVRIEYRTFEKKTRMTVPCDVCQMDSGGFAWRLDVKFALNVVATKQVNNLNV
ncbi:hypothetical protein M8C21_024319 [Ambrosia artemisiifolia]|uniref:DUF7950 domain-containing protein n=1 Tax=Ambrosia artemisiifolia TaxID=4212 RepID=A0AAD5GGP0_AMBAR|nr:hypothetical protein M8C21_024319 [Ambrosia artemisiifolia]